MTDTPILETGRLILRKPAPRDAEAFIAFLMSERGRFVGGPVALGKAWRAFASIIGHWEMRGYGMFVIELKTSGEAIGQAGPWFPGDWPEPEMSWSLWTGAAEARGYAYEAARAALGYMHEELEIKNPVSYIDAENTRSMALAKRLGAAIDPDAVNPFRNEDGEGYIFRHSAPDPIGGGGGMEAYV